MGAALREDSRPEKGGCAHCSERNRQSQLGNESSGRSPASGCRGRGACAEYLEGEESMPPWAMAAAAGQFSGSRSIW